MVQTKFNDPKSITEARRQANIVERAEKLFQTGYTMEETFGGGGMTYTVTAPEGHSYEVNTVFEECNCAGFAQDRDCKHRIAVALEVEREAAQVAKLEEENRWWQEAGFTALPLYCR